MFKCAIAAATLQHREANASVMRFLVVLIENAKSLQDCSVSHVYLRYINVCLQSSGGSLQVHLFSYVLRRLIMQIVAS